MLQVNVKPFASDCLEEAMALAQIKALNSFTFSDCLNYLNYAWSDIYSRIAAIDDGYYAKTVQIKEKHTVLPKYVKNTMLIYKSREAFGSPRNVLRESGNADMNGYDTYHIDGVNLYCPAATTGNMWLRYVPACPQIFFTHHNRDPKIYADYAEKRNNLYGLYKLIGVNDYTKATEYVQGTVYYEYSSHEGKWLDASRYVTDKNVEKYFIKTAKEDIVEYDITDLNVDFSIITGWRLLSRADNKAYTDITRYVNIQGNNYVVDYISCDFPYIFISYKHIITGEYMSGFLDRDMFFNHWNAFDFTGRGTNCRFIDAKHNDKTGLSVVVKDYNDNETIKELGWTPDTILDYPCPEMYRYLVARLADKFSALNESNVMGVQKELVEAKYAFEAYLDKNKSAWKRINNVNPATIADYL